MKLALAMTLAASLIAAFWLVPRCAPLMLAVDRLDGAAAVRMVCDPPRPFPI